MTTTEPTTLAAIRAAMEKMTPGPYKAVEIGRGGQIEMWGREDEPVASIKGNDTESLDTAHAIALLLNHGPALVEGYGTMKRSLERITMECGPVPADIACDALAKLNEDLDGDGGGS